MTDPTYPYPGLPWPERVEGLFEDGPLAGRLLLVPARVGLPPFTVGVLLDQVGEVVEVRAGNELPDGDLCSIGWVRYMHGPTIGRRPGEPHTFLHRADL